MKPHKHAELIKAWADGAIIQVLEKGGIWDFVQNPSWYERSEYRIKPEPKTDVVRYCLMDTSHGYSESEYLSKVTDGNAAFYGSKDMYIKVVFDGETCRPKHTELVNVPKV